MMDYPDPLVFEPLQLPHQQTFILLHGRGSWAEKFGPELLQAPIQNDSRGLPKSPFNREKPSADGSKSASQTQEPAMTIQTAFPHARFVFPTAARRRAMIYKRAYTHQWFDNWKLDPPATEREELQIEGLHETTKYLHQVLRKEIAIAPGGARNVVFGGLSQGCAASLVALLLWEGEHLGAVVGMCGRLPFVESLMEEIRGREDEWHVKEALGFDPFAAGAYEDGDGDDIGDKETGTPAQRAITWLREQVDLPALQLPSELLPVQRIPIFLGHGGQDEKVSIVLGRRASECLSELGASVCWKEYDDLGHWYSSDMLKDLLQFLQDVFGSSYCPR